jgi:hypothetical protein
MQHGYHGHAAWPYVHAARASYSCNMGTMDMQHRHAVWAPWTCSMVMQCRHAAQTIVGHAAWTCSVEMHRYAAGACSRGMQHGHAACACSMGMQYGHAAWACSMGMQHGYAVWACSMGIQHGHSAWAFRWAFSMAV